MLSRPPPTSAVTLIALTLRGIGSYFDGARLEVRPITILCGKNGSGKSWWFKAINLLRDSQALLPFRFDRSAFGTAIQDHTNARVKLMAREDDLGQEIDPLDHPFGPLGTIGLEFLVSEDLSLGEASGLEQAAVAESVPQSFLWHGNCPAGTRLRVRMAHPSSTYNEKECTNTLRHLVELTLNDRYRLRLHAPCLGDRGEFASPYCVEVSAAFLPDQLAEDAFVVPLGEYDAKTRVFSPDAAGQETHAPPAVVEYILSRVHAILERFFTGYFYVGAIRDIEARSDVDESLAGEPKRRAEIANNRHVGEKGEYTWDLERAFSLNPMRQAPWPATIENCHQRFIANEIREPLGLWGEMRGLRDKPVPSALGRLWQSAAAPLRQRLEKADAHWAPHWESLIGTPRSQLSETKGPVFDAAREEFAGQLAALFNSLLDRRDLYDPTAWPDLGEEAQNLINRDIRRLDDVQLLRFNRLLVEKATGDYVAPAFPLVFETYVSSWLDSLVETKIDDRDGFRLPPKLQINGYLESYEERPFDAALYQAYGQTRNSLERFLHGCFWDSPGFSEVSPQYLSAGFHQTAPFIVQTGLMRKGEVVAIENPEVHLHPSLQIQLTEFLLREARLGKTIFLETHSDLVIRRIVRVILEEELPQESIRIYFTELHKDEAFLQTRLARLQVNDQGRIDNWPAGFLDDDVKESRRLMNIMYGTPPEEEKDAE
jgi:hypothetical protein